MQEVLGIKIKLDGANLRDVHTTPTLIVLYDDFYYDDCIIA